MLVLVLRAGILILGTIDFVLSAASVVLVTVTGEALDVVEIVEAGTRAFLAIVFEATEMEFIEVDAAETTFDVGLALAVVDAGIAALGVALAVFNMVMTVVGVQVGLVAVVGAEVDLVAAIFGMAFKLAAVSGAEVGLAVFNTVLTAIPKADVGSEVGLVVIEAEAFLFLAVVERAGTGAGTEAGVCLLISCRVFELTDFMTLFNQ